MLMNLGRTLPVSDPAVAFLCDLLGKKGTFVMSIVQSGLIQ